MKNSKGKSSRTISMITLTLAIEMFAILFILLYFTERPFNMGEDRSKNIIAMILGIISVSLAFYALLTSYLSVMKKSSVMIMKKN